MSLRNSARKAVALDADLILAFGTSAALAAKAETYETPVLFADAVEPEAIGLVTHSKKDSQLATGVRGNAPLQTLFKLLRELTPVSKLAIILDGDVGDKQLTAVFKDAAKRRAIEVVPVFTHDRSAAAVMRAVNESGADGLLFVESEEGQQPLMDLAFEQKLPMVSIVPGMAERGALLVMEVSPEEEGEALADMTKAVLDGEFPESMPVVIPHHTEIVINMKSAQMCGLQVHLEVLSQATRVIR
jgi:putative ABC transport system substrate-binding protein